MVNLASILILLLIKSESITIKNMYKLSKISSLERRKYNSDLAHTFEESKNINNDFKLTESTLPLEVMTSDANDKPTFSKNELTRKLPSAIIIGSSKCGTRALLEFIGVHPNVVIASKEIYFFSRNYKKGLPWYMSQMPLSNEQQITIEKTPTYFITGVAPKRVFDLNPKMKLILALRDPVVRAVSDYVMRYGKHNYNDGNSLRASEDFESFIYKRNGEINENHFLVKKGLYYLHLQNWLEYFPKEQILFINGHELIREPSVEIGKLQKFLNLTVVIKKENFVGNIRQGFYCIKKPSNLDEVKCLEKNKGVLHPTIDEAILNDLRHFYRPYNEELFSFLNETPWWTI